MNEIDIEKDTATKTLTVTTRFTATVEAVWQIWADPRRLERWWGPPEYPATVLDHDLVPGGSVTYVMTGPTGDQHRGWWKVIAVEAPARLEVEDGFADADGVPNLDLPTTHMTMTLVDAGDGWTTMTLSSRFSSIEAMEQLVAMGMVEGITAAIGQIDGVLPS